MPRYNLLHRRSPAFSEFRGRHAVHIPEKFCKVKLVAEAQLLCNITDRQSAFTQKVKRLRIAETAQVLERRTGIFPVPLTLKSRIGPAVFFGKLIQVDILPEMSLHIFRDIQDGLFIPVQMLLLLRIDGFKQKQSRQLVDPVGRPQGRAGNSSPSAVPSDSAYTRQDAELCECSA